ncbi:SRPBCC family protein [Nocardia sp. NBC_01329]|uniref:SRPBCC family protein n=1 Tax=Nocardia sp. NBC_01329 TaxID=2903594 RepID=UPI002E14CB3F|nr:SRPBCC family protein [Nocardia sp. NBC_01329]
MGVRYVEKTLTRVVPGVRADVRNFYQDLTELGKVHPLIVGVERLPDTDDDGGQWSRNYRVTDRMPFGPFSYRITYRVRSRETEDGSLVVDAYQFPRVHVHSEVQFAEHDSGTLVTERLRLGAPWGLLGTVRRHGVAAHVTMLDNLHHLFDTAAGGEGR